MATKSSGSPRVITIEVSPAELLDKISILEIKSERISDSEKLANVRHELDILRQVRQSDLPRTNGLSKLERNLKSINETLWDIEDQIRTCDAQNDFGATFIKLAQSVYRENDHRATVKKEINLLLGASIVEEKSYAAYRSDT